MQKTETKNFPHSLTLSISHRRIKEISQRLFDLLVACLGLLILGPWMALTARRIRADSPGPEFYRGRRVGKDGQEFFILKFRTMYERPESYLGPKVTALDDPRVTALGRWLRDTKLNELPQLINVLRGEMSLVGPRPEDPDIVATWPEEVRKEILSVRPGITSPASVHFRNEEGLLSNESVMRTYMEQIVPSKLRLDQLYVRNRSFWVDLDVLFWTFVVLLPKLSKYEPVEGMLLFGPAAKFFKRYLNWFIVDALISFAAMMAAGLFWRSTRPLHIGGEGALWLALSFGLLFSLIGAILGMHKIVWSKANASDVFDLAGSALFAALIAFAGNQYWWITGIGPNVSPWKPIIPPGLIVIASALAFTGFVMARYRARLFTGLGIRLQNRLEAGGKAVERVLIIGGGESGQLAAWLLGQRGRALRLVGFVDDDLYKQDVRVRGAKVLGRREDIPRLVQKFDVGLILFAIHKITPKDRSELMSICLGTQARVALLPDIPGALMDLAAKGRSSAKSPTNHGNPSETEGPSPRHLRRSEVTPLLVDCWLSELQIGLESDHLDEVKARVKEMREVLNGQSINLDVSGNGYYLFELPTFEPEREIKRPMVGD